jgi:dephospho-CoA kinase
MPEKKLKIGITGGIGSGKSLACKYFEKLGYKVIYADKIAKELYASNNQLINKLVKEFGSGILDENGKLSRANARKIIFTGKNNILRVNKIVHPFVFAEMDKLVSKIKDRVILFEAAIMFESGSYKRMNYVVLIYANKETRIKRIIQRDGVKRKDVLNLMKLQLDEREKVKRADFIIKNNSNPADLNKNVKAFGKILKRL